MEPDPSDVAGFETYTKQYQACLCSGKSCGTGVLKDAGAMLQLQMPQNSGRKQGENDAGRTQKSSI